jgi:hypothetical protein
MQAAKDICFPHPLLEARHWRVNRFVGGARITLIASGEASG